MEFFALLRWEEVVALRIQDLSFFPHFLDVRVRKSKTDQLRQGSSVRIARQDNRPHNCPVNISQIYIRMLKYPPGFNGLLQPRIRNTKQGQAGSDLPLSYSSSKGQF